MYLAIVAGRDPRRGRKLVADALARGAFEVAGIALARGECDGAAWRSWLEAMALSDKDDTLRRHLLEAWRPASSTARRAELIARLGSWAAQESWPVHGARVEWIAAGFGARRRDVLDALTERDWMPDERVEQVRADLQLPVSRFEQLLRSSTEHEVGRSRALTGMSSWWPDRGVIALVRAWGGRRAAIANSAQTLISLGHTERDVREHVQRLAALAPRSGSMDARLEEQLIDAFTRPCSKFNGTQGFAGAWASWRAREWMRYWHTVAVDIESDVARAWIDRFATEWAHQWFLEAHGGQRPDLWCADLAELVAMTHRTDAAVEVASIGHRATTRISLASYRGANDAPAFQLVREGCRMALGTTNDLAGQLALWASRSSGDPRVQPRGEGASQSRGDEFWRGFTRQLVRRHVPGFETSTEAADRALLERAVAKPDRYEARLAWAIRFYMRGDLVLDDGRSLSLDAICDDASLPRISIHEDLFA